MEEKQEHSSLKRTLTKTRNILIFMLVIFAVGFVAGYYIGHDVGFEKALEYFSQTGL